MLVSIFAIYFYILFDFSVAAKWILAGAGIYIGFLIFLSS